jgi:hypothetical protein
MCNRLELVSVTDLSATPLYQAMYHDALTCGYAEPANTVTIQITP